MKHSIKSAIAKQAFWFVFLLTISNPLFAQNFDPREPAFTENGTIKH
ncbi:MAG: hypothetical protein ACE5G1_10705 [bacterium]